VSASHASSRIIVRFGEAILDAGFTTVPNLVLRHFSALGITHSEMLFTVCVWQYWWTEKDPYPALGTIAAQLGVSWRQTQRYAKSLEAKGYLTITHRNGTDGGQLTSEYEAHPGRARGRRIPP
jgi:DNA replication protein